MTTYNHELKNTETDSPGFLIDKFDSSGRIIITVYTDVFTNKISFRLRSNTKDLFEHLLKPSVSFSMVTADTSLSSNTDVIIFPVVFPTGFVDSITFISTDFSKIESFELACYGNEVNTITGSKQWFYTSSEMMEFDGECSYRFRNSEYAPIVPYSFNFTAARLKFKEGGGILAKNTGITVGTRLKELDYQYTCDFDISSTKTIPEGLASNPTQSIPFIQFNVLKAS